MIGPVSRTQEHPLKAIHLSRVLVSVTVGLALAAPLGAGEPTKVTTVGGITEYRLDNGLRVLLFPDDSRPTVTINATYLVGSRHEGYGESGMAHLLEHMLFKGTPTHPQIWKLLQDHGAQFNGSTNNDRTNYFETLAATPENLEFALALEADRMVNSRIAAEDLASEFSVVRNEFEMGENSPVRVLSERIASSAYLWHNYGKSTIGSREDIERVPVDRLRAFYKKFYQPDNAYLIVAGKFDEAKTLARINELYGVIPRPERKLEPTYTVEPTQDGEREVVLRRTGDVQAIGAVYHICAASHEDAAPLQVLANILSTEQTGRLYKALIEPQLASSVDASSQAQCEPGIFEVTVQARLNQSLAAIRKTLLETLDDLGRQTFTDEEVNRARQNFARTFELMLADSQRVALRLSESAAHGDWRLLFLQRDRIAKVTPADVQRVAARYFVPSNRTVGVFTPEAQPARAAIPATPDVAALLKDYKDTRELSKGEAFEASYANIEQRTERITLAGGMKVALLPKQTRGDKVSAALTFHYGSEAELTGKTTIASYLAPMLMRGTTTLSRRQIQDKLAELKAQVRIGEGGSMGGRYVRVARDGPGTLDVTIEATRENLPAVLELVAQILQKPAFPQDEFDKLQSERVAAAEAQLSEPQALATNALQRKLASYPPTDIRYVPTPAEQVERLKSVKLEDVQALYRGLVGGNFSEAAVVGDFESSQMKALLDRHFDTWRSPTAYSRIQSGYQPAAAETVVIRTPDKANSMVTLGMPLEIRDDDADYPALLMANTILGGSSSSRLLNRIRQKEGIAYGCGSMMTASARDKVGTFIAFSICAPQNAEKAVSCAREEIARFIKDGVPQTELDDARKGYRQALEVGLSSDGAVAGLLTRDLNLGRTLKFSQELLTRIEALTPEQVQAALAKYVQPEKLIVVRAGDFAAKVE